MTKLKQTLSSGYEKQRKSQFDDHLLRPAIGKSLLPAIVWRRGRKRKPLKYCFLTKGKHLFWSKTIVLKLCKITLLLNFTLKKIV